MTKETSWSTSAETLAVLGCSERTLRRYAASGKIGTTKIGRSTFYDIESYQEQELEDATEADTLVKTEFVAVIYNSTKNPNNTVGGRAIIRPTFTAMIPGGLHQLYDGTFGKVWKNVTFCLGANLDIRMPSNGGLILSEEWNAIAIQGSIIKLIESGELQVFLPSEEQFGASYRSYDRMDALKLVDETWDAGTLDRYAVNEDRPLVLAAVEEKRQEIEKAVNRNRTQVIAADDFRRNYRGVA